MEESSNGVAFVGENSGSGLFCPPSMMMMPLVTSHHHHHQHHQHSGDHHPLINPNPNPNPNPNTNHTSTLFLPTPCTNTTSTTSSSSFSIMLQNTKTTNNNNNINSDKNTTGLRFGCCFMETHHNNLNNNDGGSSSCSSSVKAKIMAHPHYPRLLAAYVNCQKVGAPPEVVARLDEACAKAATAAMGGDGCRSGCIGEDPALDQFMEAYCEMLTKYEQELSKPFKEAMFFLQNIERQFRALTIDSPIDFACNENTERNESSEEDIDVHNSNMVDPQAEDRELKGQLLRKYSGYLGSLKQEFMKKRKKGKLPKEARQQLLDWWTRHYKWPYPSESQKVALAESTGLDQKQINNWFINQRKRHWKPSEDMQFVLMDPIHPHYYMDNVLANPYSMDFSHTML